MHVVLGMLLIRSWTASAADDDAVVTDDYVMIIFKFASGTDIVK